MNEKINSKAVNFRYILDNIERNDGNPNVLSPRSREVYEIRKLNKEMFAKYNRPPKT